VSTRRSLATSIAVSLICLLLHDGGVLGEQTDAWTADYLQRGVSMRARGLNGAFVGVVDDATSTVINPSGLVYLEGPQVFGTVESLNFSTFLSFIGAALPQGPLLDSNSTRRFSIGGAWLHLYSGDFERRTESDYALGEFSVDEGVIMLSAAAAVKPSDRTRLSGGVTQKFLYQSVEDMNWGSGVDVGMQFQLMRNADDTSGKLAVLGVAAVNLVQPKIGSDEETLDRASRAWKVGASLDIPGEYKTVSARLACEMDFTQRWTWESKFVMGLELIGKIAAQRVLFVRTGFAAVEEEDDSWSFGFGVRIPMAASRVDADMVLAENVGARSSIVRSDVVRTSLAYTWLRLPVVERKTVDTSKTPDPGPLPPGPAGGTSQDTTNNNSNLDSLVIGDDERRE